MTTETIEWFTPEEKMPEKDAEILMLLPSNFVFGGWWDANDGFVDYENSPLVTPIVWAYIPQGPQ